jgi:hypothetical protein
VNAAEEYQYRPGGIAFNMADDAIGLVGFP